MTQVIAGLDRQQTMVLAEHLVDYVDESSPVRTMDAFVDVRDPAGPGFTTAACCHGSPWFSSGGDAAALYLRISQPGPVVAAVGARLRPQSGTHPVDGTVEA